MSTYESLKGLKVKYLSADTSGDRLQEGEIFYNSSDFNLKSFVSTTAFHAGANLVTSRSQLAGSTAGTQSANFAVGGEIPPGGLIANCEEYNGTGWSTGGDSTDARRKFAGAGTLTAGLVFGGATPGNTGNTETYDGSSFTEVNNMGTARAQHGGVGSQTAALACGGYDTARTAKTEEYDGTNWAEQNDMSTARSQLNSTIGTQTAAIVAGGNTTPGPGGYSASSEEYNGTSWTAGGSLAAGKNGAFGFGILTSGIVTGGEVSGGGKSTTTEYYDGTSFSSLPATPATGRMSGTAAGSSTSGIIVSGSPSGTLTEEFSISLTETTGAAFASGGNNNTYSFGRNYANMGTQNATYINGGYNYYNLTEEYNGSSWSESGDTSNGRYFGTGAGTQTAGLAFGGYLTGGATNVTEEYDGSSWTNGGNMNVTTGSRMGGGPQTAAIGCGGTGPITATEYYNGSSWSTQPATLNETHRERNGVGTQSSYVAMGGTNPGETVFYTDVEEYNGSAWTSVAELVVASKNAAGIFGNSAAGAVYCGGQNDNPNTNIDGSQVFNGTTVFTGVSPAQSSRSGNQGAGTTSSGLISARYGPGANSKTEEFTGETTAAAAVKTIDFD